MNSLPYSQFNSGLGVGYNVKEDYINTLNGSSNLKTRKLWKKLYLNNVNQGPCVITHIPCIKDKDKERLGGTNDFYKHTQILTDLSLGREILLIV